MKTKWFVSSPSPPPASSTIPPSHSNGMDGEKITFITCTVIITLVAVILILLVLGIASRKLYEKCNGCFAAFSTAANRIASCRNAIRAGMNSSFARFNNSDESIELVLSRNNDLEAATTHSSTSTPPPQSAVSSSHSDAPPPPPTIPSSSSHSTSPIIEEDDADGYESVSSSSSDNKPSDAPLSDLSKSKK